jgi:DNA-binding CsgD family transcriptional regulator
MEKISGFISGLSFPACVVDGHGELALINPAMRRSHGDGGELSIAGSCSFTPSEELNDCGNCSHYPVTKGRCVIQRVTKSSRLVMAVGLEKMGDSTVAFYTNGSAVNPVEAHAALGGILSLAGYGGKGKSRVIKVPAPSPWEAKVHLKDLVERAVDGLDFGPAGIDLKVGGEVSMDFASLSAARLIIRRMAVELLGLEPVGAVTARSFSKSGEGATAHVISLQVDIKRQAAKSSKSEISAMGLRLSRYCHQLGRMMGLAMPDPLTLLGGGKADLRFELAGGFTALEEGLRKNGADAVFKSLSSREQEVVEMVAAGLVNEAISKKLGIKVSTVKQHIKNIYRRTKVKSRQELILRAGG